jgi:hypothetical protein
VLCAKTDDDTIRALTTTGASNVHIFAIVLSCDVLDPMR